MGVGSYIGVGLTGGLSHSDCGIPSGISTSDGYVAIGNLGLGRAAGGSLQYSGGENGGISGGVGRQGFGFGLQASAGWTQTTTIATPALW